MSRGNGLRLSGSRCQCAVCGEYFSSPRSFDRHRVGRYAEAGEWKGKRRCLTLPELLEKGWERNLRGFMAMPDQRRATVEITPLIATPAANSRPAVMTGGADA